MVYSLYCDYWVSGRPDALEKLVLQQSWDVTFHYGMRHFTLMCLTVVIRSAAAYSRQTFPWMICRSVCESVCPVHCGKTVDRIWQPFGIIGRTGPGMRQVVGFGDRSAGRDTFGGKFGSCHCNQWGLDFTAYVSDSSVMQPSFQITLSRLVDFYCSVLNVGYRPKPMVVV